MQTRFNGGKPFRHLLIDNFLNEKKAGGILKALMKEHFEHKESDLFSLNQTRDFSVIKKGILLEFYEFFCSEDFGKWIERITGIKLKTGKIDMAGSLYKNCDYLLCHDDRLEERKIAYIYYLSEDFNESDGGAFVMLKSKNEMPGDCAEKHLPVWNSFLIFEVSDKSFHEVEEVLSDKKRYAIGGWLH